MNTSVVSNVPLKEESFRQISIADSSELAVGTVFIKRHTRVPDEFEFEAAVFSKGWQVIHGMDASVIEMRLREHSWSFSFVVPAITSSAYGLRSKGILRRALKRALDKVEELGMNAMEIRSLELRKFAGLDWVKVVAHPRQVSDTVFLHPFDLLKRDPRVWEPQTFDPYRDMKRRLSLEQYPGLSGR